MSTVRLLTPDDWSLFRGVRLWALGDSPHAFVADYDEEVNFSEARWRERILTGRVFVAFDGEDPVGTATGVVGWSGDPAKRELIGMWVAPSHRRQGVAKVLLDHVADWARSDGGSALQLGVVAGNEAARNAYLKLGLIPVGEVKAEWNNRSWSIETLELRLDS